MAELDWNHARTIKNMIMAENVDTFIRVENDHIVLKSYNLTNKQRELVSEHGDQLALYLKTPPRVAGQCVRGHEIEWICNKHGDWVCSCYRREQLLNTVTLYTFGYLKPNVQRTLKELEFTECPVVDVRFKPFSSHHEWSQSSIHGRLGSLYYHIPDLGNELYREALNGQFAEPRIKLHNVDRGLRQLKDILDRYKRAAIFCACNNKKCHRFEVALQADATIPNLKIMHL